MTQTDWVVAQLKQYGKITRNQALQNYISRLGAIICTLKTKGYKFETKFIEVSTPFGKGKDFEYKVVDTGSQVPLYFATFGSGHLLHFDVNPMKVAVYMPNCSESELIDTLNKAPFNNNYYTTYPIKMFSEMHKHFGVILYSIEELLKLQYSTP